MCLSCSFHCRVSSQRCSSPLPPHRHPTVLGAVSTCQLVLVSVSCPSPLSLPLLSSQFFLSVLFCFSSLQQADALAAFFFFCLACAEAHGAECDHYTHIRTLWRRFFLCHRLGCYGFQCQEKTITKVTEQIKTKKNVCFSGTATCGTVLKFVI